jgi:tRNA-splicing ligase RtcB
MIAAKTQFSQSDLPSDLRMLREQIERAVPTSAKAYNNNNNNNNTSVWLSRKDAILARTGQLGLIPGSMGTASSVVAGLGNTVALESSPRGARRIHSPSAARKKFTRAQLHEAMVGIEFRDRDACLDEIPGAHRPIDQGMQDVADLVSIRHTRRQIVNVKGD